MSSSPLRNRVDEEGLRQAVDQGFSDAIGEHQTAEELAASLDNIVRISQPLSKHGSLHRAESVGERQDRASEDDAFASPSSTISQGRTGRMTIQSFLCNVPHLCTLPMAQINSLKVMVREFDALDVVLDEGAAVQHVYILAAGTVEVFGPKKSGLVGHKRVGCITAPNLFAVDYVVFDTVADCTYHAGSANTSILLISKAQFLGLFATSAVFSESIGQRLSESFHAFRAFRDFCRALFASQGGGEGSDNSVTLHLPSLIESYKRIQPIVHTHISSNTIDVVAWQYACNRLPVSITETFVLNVVRSMPPFLAIELQQGGLNEEFEVGNTSFQRNIANERSSISFVLTNNRRRSSWRIGERGHLLTVARDGFTDILDLSTSLCIHIVEAKKLRTRLQTMVAPSAVELLRYAVWSGEDPLESINAQNDLLKKLPLSETERVGLMQIWGASTVFNIYNIVMHSEQYIFRLDRSLSKRFEADSFVRWGIVIRRQLLRQLGLDDHLTTLPDNVSIDILCCNSYIAKNLLSVRLGQFEQRLKDFASINSHAEVLGHNWHNMSDPLYYLISKLVTENASVREELKTSLVSNGFTVLEDTANSGLQVDIIDVSKIKIECVDASLVPALQARSATTRRFIVNVDYLFGAQTDGFLRVLILTLGPNIRSINMISKAAALVGNRGDILVPNKLLFAKAALSEDSVDETRPTGNEDLSLTRMRELAGPDRGIHTGTVITIPGIILQSEALLKYYRTVYRCAGLEMEGSYCARQVEESSTLGLLPRGVKTRFAYFFSDMPLGNASGSKVSSKSKPVDVVPASYAIGRAILDLLLR